MMAKWTIAFSLAIISGTALCSGLNVAVLGSGMTGAACAQKLAENGASVTVFEAGRRVGGRMSTRKTDNGFQFDHGAQYISSPKTEDFKTALAAWEKSGWVRQWDGAFGTVDADGNLKADNKKERWVGYPSMDTICEKLLDHESIQLCLNCRAKAVWKPDESQWELFSTDPSNPSFLGSFDWLISTDRNSAAPFRDDLSDASLEEHRSDVSSIRSVRTLAAMVVLERPVTTLSMNGILFDNKPYDPSSSLSLGWAARDSSKPGRKCDDSEYECWVLQTHPEAADVILNEIHDDDLDLIRERAREKLVSDFLRFLKETANCDKVPKVLDSFGHRWGAAFPIAGEDFVTKNSQTYPSRRFISCGDYFGKYAGRVEGAFLSGIAAAEAFLEFSSRNVEQ